jgi:class 3 adenylate cyclase
MTFDELLAQVRELLQREQRLSYRAIKRRFALDDEYLEDLKAELVEAKRLAADEDGKVLVWIGGTVSASSTASSPTPAQASLAYTPSHLTEKILAARRTLEGERKQVSVFFADIKDSTRLIEGLDPEAAQRLLDPAIHIMMHAVHRYEGTVNQVLGDGIMALFGAPIAHEDHALRACYAALALQSAISPYAEEVRRTQGMVLQLRVGLNSGEVVVRAIGNDLHMEYSAVGQNTHLAARMEQLAAPGSILLTAATLRLVEGLVRVNALGPMPVKGLTDPVEVFELVGASACCCAKVRRNPSYSSLRICTGSTLKPRLCSILWSRAYPRFVSCCWSTTAPSISMAGAARHTTHNCGWTRFPRRVPRTSSWPCWATTPALPRSNSS